MVHPRLLVHGSPPETSAPQGREWQETEECRDFVNSQGCCDREHVLGGFDCGELTSHRSGVPVWDDRKGKVTEDLLVLSRAFDISWLISKYPSLCSFLLIVFPAFVFLWFFRRTQYWGMKTGHPRQRVQTEAGKSIACNLLRTYRWATEKQKDPHTPRQERETYIRQTRQRCILASQRHWDILKVILMSNIKRQSA